MAYKNDERVEGRLDKTDHIAIKFGGIEAKISGFRIAAFTIVALSFLGWLLL